MEISNNINSVILDIDKLTFKKEGVDNFLIHLQPSKENATNTNKTRKIRQTTSMFCFS